MYDRISSYQNEVHPSLRISVSSIFSGLLQNTSIFSGLLQNTSIFSSLLQNTSISSVTLNFETTQSWGGATYKLKPSPVQLHVVFHHLTALKRWWTNSNIYQILFKHSNSDISLYISNLWLHLILSTASIIDFPSNMPFSQAMQSSSSTIALQPLILQ